MEGRYWDAPVTEHKKQTIFFISNTRFAYRMTENYLMLLLPIKIFNSLKRKLHSTQSEAFQNSFFTRMCCILKLLQQTYKRSNIVYDFQKNSSYNYVCIILKAKFCLFYIWVVDSVIFLCPYLSEMILQHKTFSLKIIELNGI